MTPEFWKNKKVLITGHTGFKGAWLTYILHSWGAKVSGFSLAAEIPSFYQSLKLDRKCVSYINDLRNPESLKEVIAKENPEIVFHLAAQSLVRPSYQDPIGTYMTNVMGTAYVLEALRSSPSTKSCIVITSDKCYENLEQNIAYKETDAMGGWDPYSSSKGCAELVTASWVRSFFKDQAIGIASARAGNVIGGGDFAVDRLIPDGIRSFIQNKELVIRNPSAVRPWQHVLEPLSGYILLAEKNYSHHQNFRGGWNFGPGPEQELTVEHVVNAACQHWGEGAQFRVDSGVQPHEAKLLKLDCTKAQEKLNWQPRLSFSETIKWTLDWYKMFYKNPERLESLTAEQVKIYTNLK